MRAKEFLLEYSREITAKKLGEKLLKKFKEEPVDQQQSFIGDDIDIPDEQILNRLFEIVEESDPTNNKIYVPWMITVYIRDGNMMFEDIPTQAQELLSKFYALTQRRQIPPPNNDINRIKSIANLFYLLQQYTTVELKKDEAKGRSEEIYRDSEVRVIHPLDETASCYYGRGTTWCTAGTTSYNRFNLYNEKGSLYIILPRKPKYPQEKYQIYLVRDNENKRYNEFKNEINQTIDPRELFFMRFPQLTKALINQINEAGLSYIDKEITSSIISKLLLDYLKNNASTVAISIIKQAVDQNTWGRDNSVFGNDRQTIKFLENMIATNAKSLVSDIASVIKRSTTVDAFYKIDWLQPLTQNAETMADDLSHFAKVQQLGLINYCDRQSPDDVDQCYTHAYNINKSLFKILINLIPQIFKNYIKTSNSNIAEQEVNNVSQQFSESRRKNTSW